MKNKIKYLLGLLIVGVGLLFSQSFSEYVYIETVTPLGSYTSNSPSASYLFTFNNQKFNYPSAGYFGYSIYNGLTTSTYYGDSARGENCPSRYSGYVFNSSLYEYSPFNYHCVTSFNNGYFYSTRNTPLNSVSDSIITVALGTNNNFGSNFVGLNTSAAGSVPHYGFGKGFFGVSDFLSVNSSTSNYFRFFYPYLSLGDNIYSNPVDGFDITTMTGSTQTGSYAWEYFYYNGTRTNYGYIVDDGNSYTKYKHFGLFQMGYSYTYGKVSRSTHDLTRNQLGFRTVSDNVQVYLQHVGDVDNATFNDYSSGFSNLSRNGLLLLRSNSYTTFGNDNGVYVLSKNPNNLHQILYEHWSCNTSNIDLLINNATGCVKLDGGFLNYSGNINVLPFNSLSDSYYITGVLSDYPLLYDLVNGGQGLTSVRGFNSSNSSCLYINNSTRCYGFTSNSSVDILEQYLNGGTTTATSQLINESIVYNCLNNSDYALRNPLICNAILEQFGGVYALGSGYYYQIGSDSSGNITIEIIDQAGLFENHTGYVWIQDTGGNWVTNCDGGWCNPNPSNVSGSQFLSGGILTEEYYNSTGLFFACPYPYEPLFTMGGRDLKLGKFDILGPINCFLSAFKYGKSFNFLDNAGLYDFGPLITGNTQNHRILFRFFDFLLIMWFVVFFTFLYKRFK